MIEKRLAELKQVEQGLAALRAGRHDEALAAFTAALALNPSPDKLDLIARCHHRAGRIDQAILWYERLVGDAAKAGSRLAAGERGLCDALRDAGRLQQADEVAGRLLARFDTAPAAIATALLQADMPLPYAGWMRIFDKGRLAETLAAYAKAHPASEIFWPESFLLPGDADRLAAASAQPGALFIVKPTARSGGKGIALTRRPPPRVAAPSLVQRYIDNPHLIEGKKGHIRLYLLVGTGETPRAYLYREGILRIAPEAYATDDASLPRMARHVTNTALHRTHPDLVISDDPQAEDVGNVRSLSALLRRLEREGIGAEASWRRLALLARRLLDILAEAGLFRDQAREHAAHCFPPLLFGLDLLLDASGRPWLIECQRSPAIEGGALVNRINAELFQTAFPFMVQRLPAGDREAGLEALEGAGKLGLFERLL